MLNKTSSKIIMPGLLACLCLALATGAQAATQYATNSFIWDNGTTAAWGSVSGGPYTSVWTSGNDAVFEGIPGTVTLASPTAHNLNFNTTGYILSGASTLTLNAPAPTVTLGSGISASVGNNTAAVIGGTAGLVKSGAGTLLLNGSAVHTFTGGLTVNGGTLALDYGNLASPVNLVDSGNAMTLATGGGLTLTGKATGTTIQTNNGVTVSAGYSPVIISRNGASGSASFIMGALTRSAGSVLNFQPATAWTTAASTTEIVKTTGINGAGLPGSASYFGAWGVWGSGTSTRYAQINPSGQFIAGPSATALTANAANLTSATTVFSTATATTTYTPAGSRTGYGLLGNAASGATATFTLGANTLTLNGILQINAGALTFSGATGAGGLVVGDENELVVIGNSGTINLNAPIANKPSNSSRVTIGGSATLVSGAQHTYTGGTTLVGGGGTIVTTVSSTGGSAGNPTTGPFGGGTAVLNLAGGSIRSTTGSAQTIANTVNISADTTFPNVGSEKTLTFSGPVTLTGGTRTLTGNVGASVAAEAVVFSGAIGDGGVGCGLTKAGTGTGKIILSGANTYTGPTTISGGILQIGNGGTSGSLSTSSSITDNATLAFNRSDDMVQGTHFANLIAGTGTLSKSGTGRLILNQANTISNAATVFTLNAGTLVLSNSAALGSAPSGPGSQILQFANATTTCEFATDSSVNAYNTSFSTGGNVTWVVNRATAGPAVTEIMGQAVLGGATLNAISGANVSSGTPVLSFPSANLSAGTASTTTLNPINVDFSIGWIAISNNAAAKTLKLDGTSVGNVINGPIANGLGTIALIKTNSSTWTLTGANTYTGTTTISAGTLALGAAATLSGTPTIAVAAGALFDVSAGGFTVNPGQILTGSGSVNGLVTLASGGKLVPGSSVGTLTNSDLTLNAGSTLDFEFTDITGTPNDLVSVTNINGLTINGGALNLYVAGGTTPFTTNGTYNLFQYVGAIGGSGEGALTVANAQVGKTYLFGTSGGFVTITISDSPAPDYWNVNSDGSWALGANWLSGTVPDAASMIVNFSSTNGNDITAPRTVSLDGTRTLGVLAFSNSAAGFTLDAGSGGSLTFNNGSGSASVQDLAGNHAVNVGLTLPGAGANVSVGVSSTLSLNGPVSGSGNVSVTGPGTLVLGADNGSYSGNTAVASGSTLQVGSGATSGSLGSGTVANSGALVFNRNDAALVAVNNISGTGTVINNGTGTVTLSGTSTYSGATAINSGSLAASGGAAIGDSSPVVLANVASATLKLDSNESIGSLAGGGGSGGTVNLQANTLTIGGTASGDYAGIITGSGTLNKSGSGTATLSGANTYSGGTTNIGGIVLANNNDALGTGPVTIGAGATRLVVADGLVVSNNIIINGGGASSRGLIENSGAGNATLSNGVITVNAGLSGGGDFASTGGGTLTVADPINSASAMVSKRIGTVIFSGGGSYTNFSADEGTTRLGANNGLSTSATVDIGMSQNAFLDLAGYSQTLVGIKRSSTRTVTVINSSMANDSTLTLTGTSSYPGLINDAGVVGSRVALVVDGGNFTVSGASTFSGGTLITNNGVVNTTANAGLGANIVTIASGSALNLASAGLTLSEGLAGSGTVNVFLGTGTSSTLLNKDNSGFTGSFNVGTNAPSVAGSGKVQLNGLLGSDLPTVHIFTNATVYLTGSTVTQTCAAVIDGGDTGELLGQIRLDSSATWAGPITIAGPITGVGDSTIGCNSGTGFVTGNIGEINGSQPLLKLTANTLVLSGSNSYSGPTTIGAGIVTITSSNALGTTAAGATVASGAALQIQGGITVGTEALTINGEGVSSAGVLRSLSGTNNWAGDLVAIPAGGLTRIASDANLLTLGGNISLTGVTSDQFVLQGAGNITVNGAISGAASVTGGASGGGVRTLTGTNTYTGNTLVNGGTLALAGNASIVSTNIVVIGGATFDVSGLAATFTLNAGQTLSNLSSTALLAGNVSSGAGTVSLNFGSGTPSFNVTNGTLTLSSGTVFIINNTNAALANGSYKVIGKLTGGAVAGSVPSVTVGGNGATGAPALQIVDGELFLNVGVSTLVLVSSAATNGYLDSVNFTATVLTNGTAAGNASGSVTFSANGTPFSTNALAAGNATSDSLNTLPRGTNLITATYAGDVNYLGSTNTYVQTVTNHPPVAGAASYQRNSGVVSLRIPVSELLTNVTDADSDTITLVSTDASTNGVTLTQVTVSGTNYLSYSNTNNVGDQFAYTVTDGFGGTNSAMVSILLGTNVVGQFTGQINSFSNNVANLTFYGIPNYSYITERTTNLLDWVDVSTNTAAANGAINVSDTFSDLGGTPPASAYYRLKWRP